MERFNLEKQFTINKEFSDNTWNSWTLTADGKMEVYEAVDHIKDYAHNRIREQANAYGYPHDVNLWVEDWSWEFGETVEDLVTSTELKHHRVAFSELINNGDSPTVTIYWTTYICEDNNYDFGRWFKNRHEIPVIDIFYKPFGRFDKRIESVIYSMEMGDYSRSLTMKERLEIANERLEEINVK